MDCPPISAKDLALQMQSALKAKIAATVDSELEHVTRRILVEAEAGNYWMEWLPSGVPAAAVSLVQQKLKARGYSVNGLFYEGRVRVNIGWDDDVAKPGQDAWHAIELANAKRQEREEDKKKRASEIMPHVWIQVHTASKEGRFSVEIDMPEASDRALAISVLVPMGYSAEDYHHYPGVVTDHPGIIVGWAEVYAKVADGASQ